MAAAPPPPRQRNAGRSAVTALWHRQAPIQNETAGTHPGNGSNAELVPPAEADRQHSAAGRQGRQNPIASQQNGGTRMLRHPADQAGRQAAVLKADPGRNGGEAGII